ncbi:MAG TPA: ABC transporter [Eggerthellaceae bacterium]|nr:ABC transporter [Eggerthellaceae bacterium]
MTREDANCREPEGRGPSETPALEARGLTVAWGDGTPVVQGIDLAVSEGETVCLVGKSGMGKTTLLHALAGLTMPRMGKVLLHGRDVTGQPGRVSYMLQKDLLLPGLRVIDNACLPLTLSGMSKSEARKTARPLLARFGLEEAADKWPSQLSGGMRQRAAFLRTCLMGNDVVMLDEPFSALDAITRVDVRTWFRNQARDMGLSTLMITHDADEACIMADRIYVLGRASEPDGGNAPAVVVGQVVPDRNACGQLGEYSLTPAFLQAKARVLDLLTSG